MQLSPAVEKYVLHWGEMGTRWGTNRTVAQIQALLYLSPTPLRADEIVDILSVARSNVSTSIRELQSYGLVRMTHVLGDRREYFESLYDVWELFRPRPASRCSACQSPLRAVRSARRSAVAPFLSLRAAATAVCCSRPAGRRQRDPWRHRSSVPGCAPW